MRKFMGNLGQNVLGYVVVFAILAIGGIVGAFVLHKEENYLTLEEINQLQEVSIVKNPISLSQDYTIYSDNKVIGYAKGNLIGSAVYEEIVIYDVNKNEIGKVTGLIDTVVIINGADYTLGEVTHHVNVDPKIDVANAYDLKGSEIAFQAKTPSFLVNGKIVENGVETYSVKRTLPILRTYKIQRLEDSNKMSEVIALTLMEDGLNN